VVMSHFWVRSIIHRVKAAIEDLIQCSIYTIVSEIVGIKNRNEIHVPSAEIALRAAAVPRRILRLHGTYPHCVVLASIRVAPTAIARTTFWRGAMYAVLGALEN
jgi:hypothetical protein